MGERVSRIAILTHRFPEVASRALGEVLGLLAKRHIEVLLPPGEPVKHARASEVEAGSLREATLEEIAEVDLCLALGGDGTVLRALRLTRGLGVPVAGVNLGHVGYLATIRRDRIIPDVDRLLDGEFNTVSLLGLEARLQGGVIQAVNDIMVGRPRDGGISRISYALNGTLLFDIRCDGLVASTPVGSSAYSLAAGGPVLSLGLSGFVLTYVAPHSLATRSVVVGPCETVSIRNESTHDVAEVDADGQRAGALDPLEALEVRAVPGLACLALLPENDFYLQFKERFI